MKYPKTGIFHFFIVEKIKEKQNNPYSDIVKRIEVKKILYNYSVPIKLHQQFLKEMEGLKLIKIKNKQNIKILKRK